MYFSIARSFSVNDGSTLGSPFQHSAPHNPGPVLTNACIIRDSRQRLATTHDRHTNRARCGQRPAHHLRAIMPAHTSLRSAARSTRAAPARRVAPTPAPRLHVRVSAAGGTAGRPNPADDACAPSRFWIWRSGEPQLATQASRTSAERRNMQGIGRTPGRRRAPNAMRIRCGLSNPRPDEPAPWTALTGSAAARRLVPGRPGGCMRGPGSVASGERARHPRRNMPNAAQALRQDRWIDGEYLLVLSSPQLMPT